MNGCHFRGILMIFFNHRLAGQVTYGYDMIRIIHAILFYGIYIRIHISATTVVISSMHVYNKRFATHILGMYSGRISQPVVRMDNVILFRTGHHACNDRVVIDLFQQVIGITAGKFHASKIIHVTITEISINMIAEIIIFLRIHVFRQSLPDVVHLDITPYDRNITHSYYFQETLVFIAPGLRYTKSYIHIRLHSHSSCKTKTGRTQTSQDMRREFPSKHQCFHNGTVLFGVILLQQIHYPEDSGYIHCKRDSSSTDKRRIAIEQFRNRTDTMQ